MNVEEITQYQNQLDQVNLKLKSEPENSKLLKLKTDLTELISLTSAIIEQEVVSQSLKKATHTKTNSAPTTPTSATITSLSKPLQVGDYCLARWSGDGLFYSAQITAIGGGDQVFSVVFKDFNNVELVNAQDIKPLEKNKRKTSIDKKEKEKDHKKKKAGDGQKKVNEQVAKQKTWLAFASSPSAAPGRKTTRTKRLVQPPINKKSIFATPENPEGKVGVVGSGKPMTQFQQRGKHIFDRV